MVSFGGLVFEPAGSRPEFESFFEIVEQADSGPPPDPNTPTPPGEPPLLSGSWAPWERAAAAQEAPPPTEETESSEVLAGLEADEDLVDEAGAEGHALDMGSSPTDARSSSRDILPESMSAARNTQAPRGGPAPRSPDAGPGVPTGFPTALPAAPAQAANRGVTSRDQVFDAFPMDMMAEPSRPSSFPTLPGPADPGHGAGNDIHAGPSGGGPLSGGPLGGPLSAGPMIGGSPLTSSVTLSPVTGRVHDPSIATLPPTLPMDAPTPAPSMADPRRPRSRDLDWHDERRPGLSNRVVALAAVAVIMAVVGMGTYVVRSMNKVNTVGPNTMAAADPAAPVQPPVTPPTNPPTNPVVEPVVAATDPVTAPVVAATEPTATPPKPESAPVKSSGGGAKAKVSRGWSSMEKGDYSGARASCLDAAGSGAVGAEAWFCAGRASEYQGDAPSAVQFYCKSIKSGPDSETLNAVNGRLSQMGRSCS